MHGRSHRRWLPSAAKAVAIAPWAAVYVFPLLANGRNLSYVSSTHTLFRGPGECTGTLRCVTSCGCSPKKLNAATARKNGQQCAGSLHSDPPLVRRTFSVWATVAARGRQLGRRSRPVHGTGRTRLIDLQLHMQLYIAVIGISDVWHAHGDRSVLIESVLTRAHPYLKKKG